MSHNRTNTTIRFYTIHCSHHEEKLTWIIDFNICTSTSSIYTHPSLSKSLQPPTSTASTYPASTLPPSPQPPAVSSSPVPLSSPNPATSRGTRLRFRTYHPKVLASAHTTNSTNPTLSLHALKGRKIGKCINVPSLSRQPRRTPTPHPGFTKEHHLLLPRRFREPKALQEIFFVEEQRVGLGCDWDIYGCWD